MSIAAHAHDTGMDNVLAPQSLDARAQPWPVARADAVLAINMTHIAPWSATVGLMAGAGGILPEGACSTCTARSGSREPTRLQQRDL